MKFPWTNNKRNKIIPLVFLILCMFIPSIIWSAAKDNGYKEQKLFNTDFYSPKDLKKKINYYSKEIKTIDDQVKALKTDINWLLLKINQMLDSGRTPSTRLKDALFKKQKKTDALLKGKKRITHIVQSYTSALKLTENKMDVIDKDNADKTDEYESKDIQKTKLQAAIKHSGLSDWVEIVGTGTCLRIETVLPILFPTGSAKVSKEYKSFFKKLAALVKPYDVKIFVKGYADIVPIHNKTYPSNFELGAIRAANIVHQLVNYGVKPSIFKIESSGKYRFSAKGMVKQKILERRAELTIVFSG